MCTCTLWSFQIRLILWSNAICQRNQTVSFYDLQEYVQLHIIIIFKHIYINYLHWEIFCFSISTSCSFSKTFSSVSFKASWLLRLANSASFEDVPLFLALTLGPMFAFTPPVLHLEELVADHGALYGVEDVPRTRQDNQFMQIFQLSNPNYIYRNIKTQEVWSFFFLI